MGAVPGMQSGMTAQLWQQRRLLGVLAVLYFAQGLPSGLLAKAVPAMAREAGMPLQYIGLLALAALPWALKFVWAPWVDRLGVRRAGHRKRWIIGCQLAAASVLLLAAAVDSRLLFGEHFLALLAILFLLNLCCATQDIATDGLAVRMLPQALRGPGNSIQVGGYKLGLILGGGGLLIWIGVLGWTLTFVLVAVVLVLLLWPVARFPEPVADVPSRPQLTLRWWLAELARFWGRPGMGWWLVLLLVYKVGDSFGSRMLKPFLVDSGWSLAAIGTLDLVTSLLGLAGAVLAGLLLMRISRVAGVIGFALAHALAFLAWAWLAAQPAPAVWQIWLIASMEQITDALATVVLFTMMMDHCRAGHEGSDYTLQASVQLMAAGSFTLLSGFSAAWLGYSGHFLLAAGLGSLALMAALLWWRARQS